jgi:hypothetical protein
MSSTASASTLALPGSKKKSKCAIRSRNLSGYHSDAASCSRYVQTLSRNLYLVRCPTAVNRAPVVDTTRTIRSTRFSTALAGLNSVKIHRGRKPYGHAFTRTTLQKGGLLRMGRKDF